MKIFCTSEKVVKTLELQLAMGSSGYHITSQSIEIIFQKTIVLF